VPFDVSLAQGGASPTVVSKSNYRHMYWSAAQQLVHHSVT
jgi:fumarylacetoacetase